jgi:hypothetical protein
MAEFQIHIKKIDFKAEKLADEWERFSAEFKCFMTITHLHDEPDDVKIAYFLLMMGPESQKIRSKLFMLKEDYENFDKVFKAFERYMNPFKRVRFYD